jgi:hypothetical protein
MPKKFKIVVKPNDDPPIVILTRYLYIKQEVLASLALSLIESNFEEALFWAYELYHSGFQEECIEFIPAVYREWYADKNPKLGKFLLSQHKKWILEKEDSVIGTMIRNLMNREFSIKPGSLGAKLLSERIKTPVKDFAKDNGFYIQMDPSGLEKYKTVEKGKEELPYLVPRRCCVFEARKYANTAFNCHHKDTSNKDLYLIYRDHWVYYASFSPLWRERIDQCNGYINNELKTVTFENDDDLDEFYDEFGYEPDEQPKELLQKWIGSLLKEHM